MAGVVDVDGLTGLVGGVDGPVRGVGFVKVNDGDGGTVGSQPLAVAAAMPGPAPVTMAT